MTEAADTSMQAALRAARDAVATDISEALDQRRELEVRLRELVDLAERLTAQLGDGEGPKVVRRAEESRVDAVHRVLAEAGGPISPQALNEALAAEGRIESRRDVHSALSYLASKGRSRRVGAALWEAL